MHVEVLWLDVIEKLHKPIGDQSTFGKEIVYVSIIANLEYASVVSIKFESYTEYCDLNRRNRSSCKKPSTLIFVLPSSKAFSVHWATNKNTNRQGSILCTRRRCFRKVPYKQVN
ncbi:hypothetical protein DFA_10169 [Cavenderia fasciculata]|uniref:Uncharacterized protein n=1 Tax=Cavenderia fasciculata TaxID=261658 RepID=F4Q9G6_CACFS|nr:uncharacterized protein DFA_10169 [Cavenderia fasciculata]EGG15335.1 hypothetical protein DFA_10169 [Cavenderia fasciculata]|eukprot:XP_004352055.1 hypothetical protein DFA_10169 [Cavenderia fasciculata]